MRKRLRLRRGWPLLRRAGKAALYHPCGEKRWRRQPPLGDGSECKSNSTLLKGQRYNLLRNPDNLSADGRRQLKLLLAANRDLSIVYLLKDAFKAVWTYTYRKSADKCLGNWIAMAMESGVSDLKRFASGVAEVKEQILNFCQHRITSARIEAFNTLVSRVIHKACGVANLDFLFLKLRQESLQR